MLVWDERERCLDGMREDWKKRMRGRVKEKPWKAELRRERVLLDEVTK